MDPKLYKTLKQLVKLGIINKNGKVVNAKKKRRNKRRKVIFGGIAQPTDHLRTNVNYSSPTIQSEQALVNLKASELQLERALKSQSLPDELRDKVEQQLNMIKSEVYNLARTNEYSVSYLNDKLNTKADKMFLDENEDEFNSFVPQTAKSNQLMIPNKGLTGNTPSFRDWVFYGEQNKNNNIQTTPIKTPIPLNIDFETPFIKKYKNVIPTPNNQFIEEPEEEIKEEPKPKPKPKPKTNPNPNVEIKHVRTRNTTKQAAVKELADLIYNGDIDKVNQRKNETEIRAMIDSYKEDKMKKDNKDILLRTEKLVNNK